MTLKAELKIPQWVKRLDSLMDDVAADALSETRDFLRDELRRNATKGGPTGLTRRTGTLLQSLRTYLKATPHGAELSVGMKFYGWVHNRGADIVPKAGGYLRFQLPNGRWASAKAVHLPARHWVDDAVTEARRRYPQFLRQALRRRIK